MVEMLKPQAEDDSWFRGRIGQSKGSRRAEKSPKEDSESLSGFYGKRNRTGPMLLGFGLSDQSNPEVIPPGKC